MDNDVYQRLKRYGVFSEETLRHIARTAVKQRTFSSHQELFSALGMPEVRMHRQSHFRGVPVVDIPARTKSARAKQAQGTIVIHLPMANPLDENQLYHIATIALALPNYRIIGFGNPSGAPYRYKEQTGTLIDWLAIAFTSRRRALVAAEINYLRKQGLTRVHLAGYSFGAHKALVESAYLTNSEVTSLILIDPVAHHRGVRQLIGDFKRTFKPMGAYVNRTNLPTYFAARKAAARTKHHKGALRRPISIAIGVMMARLHLVSTIEEALRHNKNLGVSVAWGSKSELGNDALLRTRLAHFSGEYQQRVSSLRLTGDTHAFANDVHLFAAIIYNEVTKYEAQQGA